MATPNKTSQAMADIFRNSLDPRTVLAFQQKYQRMEETIYRETHLAAAEGDEHRLVRMQEALAFDPLSA
jgi:hypothetical protein